MSEEIFVFEKFGEGQSVKVERTSVSQSIYYDNRYCGVEYEPFYALLVSSLERKTKREFCESL